MASAFRWAAPRDWTPITCSASARWPTESIRCSSPSISPGASPAASISTTCCPCPIPKRRWPSSAQMSSEVQEALSAPCWSKTSATYASSPIPHSGMGVRGGDLPTHRLRPAAGREQRLCQRLQSGLRCRRLSASMPRRRRAVRYIWQDIPPSRSATANCCIDDHGSAVCDDSMGGLSANVGSSGRCRR